MIPCANPHSLYQEQTRKEEILNAIGRVIDQGAYILGPEVEKFERSFAAYCGAEHGIGVNSGTDALILTLRALDIGPGDEVITVSHTALATVAAIVATGATPVLVDIESDYFTMDPSCLLKAITHDTKAIIVVHLYGQSADMDAIITISNKNSIPVIEDCAQAAGASYQGESVGSMGIAGCFSFYPTKNLGAIGDGGMVVCSDEKLATRIRRLRQYGWDQSRQTEEVGLNSRLDEIQAAILNVNLSYLDNDNAKRREIAVHYRNALCDLAIKIPAERHNSTHVYHLFVISCNQRDAIKEMLELKKVFSGIHYPHPANQHTGYSNHCRMPEEGLPVTSSIVKTILSLPIFPDLTFEQISRIKDMMVNIAE